MTNFAFLKEKTEYALFASAAIEAEKVYAAAPAMCAVGCRKALELAVKWVYAADSSIEMPYKDNLQSLVHEPTFRFAVDYNTWGKIPYIIKLGNMAVHTEKTVRPGDVLVSLRGLFEFIQWVDYCYGSNYVERKFEENLIPTEKVKVDVKKIKEQESLLGEKDAEIELLRKQIEEMSAKYMAEKEHHKENRVFVAEDLTEYETRKRYIDLNMQNMGWTLTGEDADVREEYLVEDMAGEAGKKGKVDYVLFGKDGLPLAVVEAKKSTSDPNNGKTQALLYADCLEQKFARRPMMFTTNGFETYFWDDQTGIQRKVSDIFSKEDLQRLMNRRSEKKNLNEIPIDDKITDRYYQKEAIRAVCDNVQRGFRKNLLVMATGTGKTRTASSLVDVLSRGGYVTNILFLADRTALVKQAKDDFKNYLPDMSLCNLCSNKDDKAARIVFSTYPTMLNAIDEVKKSDGQKLFSPAHFDLIIIDESHRSIFKKYRAIFEYFDAMLVGLTATPKTEVDRNTYDFFEMEHGVPTYAYDYETAVYTDHVLVPYYNYEVKTKFLEEGIIYDELSEADKERYESDFGEYDGMPEVIPSEAMNRFVFNVDTVDTVLQDLMERGIKIEGGDRIGKTIIFAQNKKHAEFILQRFNFLYPQYHGLLAQKVICEDSYAQKVIDDFKNKDKNPYIAISVDMMDTGIDVPECVNLVFFKKVRSKTKFWQMIGRGTRLAPALSCVDGIHGEYTGKKHFLIFDYCSNFEFFRENPKGFEGKETRSISENVFCKKVQMIAALQDRAFAEESYQNWRQELVNNCHEQVNELMTEKVSVRLHLRCVEKYRQIEAFATLSEGDKDELIKEIAPLIFWNDTDEAAKRFDNFMYGMMLVYIQGKPAQRHARIQLCEIAAMLERKQSIPQIKEKLSVIKQVQTDAFWEANDLLLLETVRKELHGLIQFITDGGSREPVITKLKDPVLFQQEGIELDAAYDFEDYRKKVNRYVEENGDTMAIYKLKHNIPLSVVDYNELERILTNELGSKEDYQREFGDTPFGLLIRRIVKLDHDAVMQAFSQFINDESLNQKQIAFVNKIIHHIEQNGYMEDVRELQRPPFDKPVSFIKLFDSNRKDLLMKTIHSIKKNAINVIA